MLPASQAHVFKNSAQSNTAHLLQRLHHAHALPPQLVHQCRQVERRLYLSPVWPTPLLAGRPRVQPLQQDVYGAERACAPNALQHGGTSMRQAHMSK
jgi:hypothetical protein